jgi:hypothetical protein
MSPLSPAAQAVRSAALYAGPKLEGRIAADLKIVVAHTQQRQYGDCWICDANELLAIAAELGGDPTTPAES